jgi:enoyl-CoA hydratase/carnithine racemase
LDFVGASSEPVVGRVIDGVGVISYNRPDRHNALDDAASAAFRDQVDRHLADPEVRCVLLRGEGRSFSSGRDTTQLGERPQGQSDDEYIRIAQQGKVKLALASVPVIAALQGYAMGGSLETALLADLRVGTPDLVIALPEVRYGLVPDTGGTQLLTDLVGPGRAKYLMMTGERLDGPTAHEWGLVDLLVEDPAQLDETVFSLAAAIAANAPLAVQAVKRLVDDARRERLTGTLERERAEQVRLFASEDYREVRHSLREGRPPVFRGR